MNYSIRPIREEEYGCLDEFLYQAIFVPEGTEKPEWEIIRKPEMQVYVDRFGEGQADFCLLAEADGKTIGAVWSRIMNDYGHISDEIPSLAISLLPEYRELWLLRNYENGAERFADMLRSRRDELRAL